MINLPVDEGYAFDYLSILQIKLDNDLESVQKQRNFSDCYRHLESSLGGCTFSAVITSDEYAELCASNEEVFRLVDLAKEDKVRASDVDRGNFERYKKKMALQEKFFNSAIGETKTGYEVYAKECVENGGS